MRANTSAIIASPNFSIGDCPNPQYKKWATLKFTSPSETHRFAITHARTPNETICTHGEHWLGLKNQDTPNFNRTGIADHALALVKESVAKMPHKLSRLAEPHMAVTGGYWDTPSVLANLPLAARTRKRSKLAPKQIKIGFFMSASVNAQDMATLTAKIARAIWDYTIAGGAVTLHVAHVGMTRATSTGAEGLTVETRVNASDVAGLSLALSVPFFRCDGGAIMQAFSESMSDAIRPPYHSPLPKDYLFLGGVHRASITAAETIIKSLQIV